MSSHSIHMYAIACGRLESWVSLNNHDDLIVCTTVVFTVLPLLHFHTPFNPCVGVSNNNTSLRAVPGVVVKCWSNRSLSHFACLVWFIGFGFFFLLLFQFCFVFVVLCGMGCSIFTVKRLVDKFVFYYSLSSACVCVFVLFVCFYLFPFFLLLLFFSCCAYSFVLL